MKKNIELIKKTRWILILSIFISNSLLYLLMDDSQNDHDCLKVLHEAKNDNGQIKILIRGSLKTNFEPYLEISLLNKNHQIILEKALLIEHRKMEINEISSETQDEFLIMIAQADLPKVMNLKYAQIYPKSDYLFNKAKLKVQHEISF